jgi:hypothetical protein
VKPAFYVLVWLIGWEFPYPQITEIGLRGSLDSRGEAGFTLPHRFAVKEWCDRFRREALKQYPRENQVHPDGYEVLYSDLYCVPVPDEQRAPLPPRRPV